MLAYLKANAASARRTTVNGRDFLIAPMTLIVPGVLNGSKGALYYPPSEVRHNPSKWNGIPLTLGHPADPLTNEHISATEAPQTHMGRVKNARFEGGKLKADGWFDLALTKKVSSDVYNRLMRGEHVELSTGLFTDNEEAKPGATFNGRGYTHIAKNYRPDHLAILTQQTGACSVRDGCGVNVNAKKTQNAFCPTGEGGGVDPSCGKEGGGGGEGKDEYAAKHQNLISALIKHDKMQMGKRGYNPYAIGHYMKAAGDAHEAVKAGHTVRDAMIGHFNGRLLDKALKAVGEPKASDEEHRRAGFLPKLSKKTENAWSDAAREAAALARQAKTKSLEASNTTKVAGEQKAGMYHQMAVDAHRAAESAHYQASQKFREAGDTAKAEKHWQQSNKHSYAALEHEKHAKDVATLPPNALAKNSWSDAARAAAAMARKAGAAVKEHVLKPIAEHFTKPDDDDEDDGKGTPVSKQTPAQKKREFEYANDWMTNALNAAIQVNALGDIKILNDALETRNGLGGHDETDDSDDCDWADDCGLEYFVNDQGGMAPPVATAEVQNKPVKNQARNKRRPTMNRAQMLKILVANCQCEEDQKILNELKDETLRQMVANTSSTTGSGSETVQAGGEEDDDSDDAGMAEKAKSGADKTPPAMGSGKPAMNAEAWLEASGAPPEVRAAVRNAMEVQQGIRQQYIQKLVANIKDKNARANALRVYGSMSHEDLRILANAMPTLPSAPGRRPAALPQAPASFLGLGALPMDAVSNSSTDAADDILEVPIMNYDDEAA